MSGSGRDTEIRLTADTTQLDSSLAASAAAAQSAFQSMQSAGSQTASSVTASIGQMEKSLRAAQVQMQQMGGAAKEAIGQYISAIQTQIDAAKSAKETIDTLTTGVQTNASSYAGVIASVTGLDRVVRSAEQSARVFAQSLQQLGLDRSEAEIARYGDRVQTLASRDLAGLINQIAGVRSNFQSASSDGTAFLQHMQEIGQSVQTVASRDLRGLIDELNGVEGTLEGCDAIFSEARD